MKILDASNKSRILNSLNQIWGITSKNMTEICKYHKNNDVFFTEAASEILDENESSKCDFDYIILHHFTNTFAIDDIHKNGLMNTYRWLQSNRIQKFLYDNGIEVDLEHKKIFFQGNPIVADIVETNVLYRLEGNDMSINSILFKEDFLKPDNMYSGSNSILLNAPEFIVNLDKVISIDLIKEWQKHNPGFFIVSYKVSREDLNIEYTNKEFLEGCLEWLCEGHSTTLNNIQLEYDVNLSPEQIISIEPFKGRG